MRQFFENEWFVYANQLGVSWNDFWELNPRVINLMYKGHENKIKEIDALIHTFCGTYGLSATAIAIEKNLAGRKAKGQYIKEPVLKDIGLTEEEKRNKAIQEFVEKMQVMKANYDQAKGKEKKRHGN